MRIGIIREEKIPADKRVAFTPEQCKIIKAEFGVELVVQSSKVRSFPDELYAQQGIEIVDSVADCDILFGVKEVPADLLIPGKTYFFFSHTIKKQAHNKKLMKALLEKKVTMVDYECLTNKAGERILGFGRYAGVVGTYNAMLAYGQRFGLYNLKPANKCVDRAELEKELKKVKLPPIKIVFTGGGRVASGTLEILNTLGIRSVSPEEFLTLHFDEPVYTQLHADHHYHRKDDGRFDMHELMQHPERYRAVFVPYTKVADVFISCHFWDPKAEKLFAKEDIQASDFTLKVIADITCDIDGSVPSTIRSSTIEESLYGYDIASGKETPPFQNSSITIMAVDNLPCELPRDASTDFGYALIEKVLPCLLRNDPDQVIERAMICRGGELTEKFMYLKDYAS
jgi:saccharopine dehydrogenase (NAD+, L-lysine-forming)